MPHNAPFRYGGANDERSGITVSPLHGVMMTAGQ
jgi:hypothetical protein